MTEKFQPKTLASFTKHQIEQVILWSSNNGILDQKDSGLSLDEAGIKVVDSAQVDEKGQPLNEKGRQRLRLAFKSLPPLYSFGDLGKLQTLSVRLVAEDPPALQFRWRQTNSILEFVASENRFLGLY